MKTPADGLTDLLNEWAAGDESSGNEALVAAYERLREIAHAHLRRERRDAVVQTTGIVHDAYLRLAEQPNLAWRSREHFFAFAAHVMRRILVDQARHRGRERRGGLAVHVPLADADGAPGDEHAEALDVLAVHRALEQLEEVDPAKVRLVELRFFGGLTMEEAATALGISPPTAYRQWALARAWLLDRLES